jgi:hypothetical protein
MKNYRIVKCCHNCRYLDDISPDDSPVWVCFFYYDNQLDIPEDNRVYLDGVCDYHEEVRHE